MFNNSNAENIIKRMKSPVWNYSDTHVSTATLTVPKRREKPTRSSV